MLLSCLCTLPRLHRDAHHNIRRHRHPHARRCAVSFVAAAGEVYLAFVVTYLGIRCLSGSDGGEGVPCFGQNPDPESVSAHTPLNA